MASASAKKIESTKKIRPKYLSLPAILFEIRLPVPAKVSILHRISGALLIFPLLAWLLYMLDASLASEQGFDKVHNDYLRLWPVKLGLLVFVWAYCHHFLAGIRYLLLDLNVGIDLHKARVTSWIVIVGALVLTALIGARFW